MSAQGAVLALRRATRALIWALAGSAVSTLALLWRLDGDPAFRDRAIRELQAINDLPDWNPAHFDALQAGQTLQLVNDHDPRPLRFQLDDRAFGQFEWAALESGPEVWRVQITRVGIKPTPVDKDSCCSGGACCG